MTVQGKRTGTDAAIPLLQAVDGAQRPCALFGFAHPSTADSQGVHFGALRSFGAILAILNESSRALHERRALSQETVPPRPSAYWACGNRPTEAPARLRACFGVRAVSFGVSGEGFGMSGVRSTLGASA